MATKGSKSRAPRHVGGDGKEYNRGVKLTAKMTPPEMKKRLSSKSKGK